MEPIYSTQERGIFPYRVDPEKEVLGDPLAISRRLALALGGDPNPTITTARRRKGQDGKFLAESDAELVERMAAEERLFVAVREAFGLTPFDRDTGKGATDRDCDYALNCFLRWLEKNVVRVAS